MALDPDFAAVIEQLRRDGALPITRGSIEQCRTAYDAGAARRRAAATPEPMAQVADEVLALPHSQLPVRRYVADGSPTNSSGAATVVIYVHGGGWVLGGLDSHDGVCRRLATLTGAMVIALDYGLSPEHKFPEPLQDVVAAVRAVAAQYPGHRTALAGDSAGGHLVAAACLRLRDEQAHSPTLTPVAQLLVYPVISPVLATPSAQHGFDGFPLSTPDMRWFWEQFLPEPGGHSVSGYLDLLQHDLTGLPPAVVATAEFDPLHDEGVAYAQALQRDGVRVQHIEGAGLAHAYLGYGPVVPAAARSTETVFTAFSRLLDGR